MKKKKVLVTLLLASMCAASFSLAGCEVLESLLGGSSSSASSSVKESSEPDSSVPDSSIPDSSVSDSSVSDSSEPDSSVSDSSEPDSSEPEECTEHDWSDVVVLEWDDFKGEFKPSVKGGCKNCGTPVPEEAVLSEVTMEDTATCTEAGTITYSATLTLNDEVIAVGKVEEPSEAKGHFEKEYSSDPLYHWYAKADYCHCEDVVEEKIPHTSEPVYDYNEGTTTISCSECGYNNVLDYIVNNDKIEVGENVLYLTTPKTTVLPDGYWHALGHFLQEDPEIPGNYLVPTEPEHEADDNTWQYVDVSKPESELVKGVDYEEIRARSYTTEYDVHATFTAPETGEYTFSVPSGTFVQITLATPGNSYHKPYYDLGCDKYYSQPITATMMLAEGDVVTFAAECVAEHTDTNLDDDIDTNVSYFGKGSYKFTLSVTYTAASFPGESADNPLEASYYEDLYFTLDAGESIFYAIGYPYGTYKYFTLSINQNVEMYVNGEKVTLTESEENAGTYTSTFIRSEPGKPALVEVKNASAEVLDVYMTGFTYERYDFSNFVEGENEFTFYKDDLVCGVSVSLSFNYPDQIIVELDEASFTENKVSLLNWSNSPVAGYIDGEFVPFQATADYSFYYTFQCPADLAAETVTLKLKVTKVPVVYENEDNSSTGSDSDDSGSDDSSSSINPR